MVSTFGTNFGSKLKAFEPKHGKHSTANLPSNKSDGLIFPEMDSRGKSSVTKHHVAMYGDRLRIGYPTL